MADTPTTNWGLPRPEGTDLIADTDDYITAMSEELDNVTKYLAGTLLDRGSVSHVPGQYYYATDIGVLYLSDGTNWVTINPRALTTVTSLPGSPFDDQEVHLLVDSAGDYGGRHIWPVKYRQTGNTWVALGGGPLSSYAEGPIAGLAASTLNALTGTGIVVPFTGVYEATWRVDVQATPSGPFIYGGGAGVSAYEAATYSQMASTGGGFSVTFAIGGHGNVSLTAGQTISLYTFVTGPTYSAARGRLTIRPLRLAAS